MVPMRNNEFWIWTELIAFDVEEPDCGVASYLAKIADIEPTGISILISSMDFVLQYEGLQKEKTLDADFCSRRGHSRNLFRQRQVWSNFQLRKLIAQLRSRGIKVFLSLFRAYSNDYFRREFISEHPELKAGANFLWLLNDGRRLGDVFLEKLPLLLKDYGFSGWHAPDGNGPAGSINKNYWQDNFIEDFLERQRLRLPAELRGLAGDNPGKGMARAAWLWQNHREAWTEHHVALWNDFYRRAISIVHSLGGELMLNSPDTKSIFEAYYYFGFDYQSIANMGLDYLVSETSSIATELIWRESEERDDYLNELCAVMLEMRLCMPGVKTLMMPAVQDVVESFDVIRHAPAHLERDYLVQASQQIVNAQTQKLERCANGVLVCLGDSLTEADWKLLTNLRRRSLDFNPVSGGDLVWGLDENVFGRLKASHQSNAAWSPYHQVARLISKAGLDISIAGILDEALINSDLPLLVTNYDLLNETQRQALQKRQVLSLVLGDFSELEPPENAPGILCLLRHNLKMGAFLLGLQAPVADVQEIPFDTEQGEFENCDFGFSSYRCLAPQAKIPNNFWLAIGKMFENQVGKSALLNKAEGIQLLRQKDADGKQRVMLCSKKYYYLQPNYRLSEAETSSLQSLSQFPCADLCVKDGKLATADYYPMPLHIPPKGVLMFDIKQASSADPMST